MTVILMLFYNYFSKLFTAYKFSCKIIQKMLYFWIFSKKLQFSLNFLTGMALQPKSWHHSCCVSWIKPEPHLQLHMYYLMSFHSHLCKCHNLHQNTHLHMCCIHLQWIHLNNDMCHWFLNKTWCPWHSNNILW